MYLLPLNAAKKRWLRRGLAGTETGCSAKQPLLGFLKLHESDQLFSISLSAWPSSCRRASVCGCGKEHARWGCGGSHQGLTGAWALLPALHYSETLQDLVEPFSFSSSSISFSSPSSSFSFSKCSVVQGGLQSNQKAPETLTLLVQPLVPWRNPQRSLFLHHPHSKPAVKSWTSPWCQLTQLNQTAYEWGHHE